MYVHDRAYVRSKVKRDTYKEIIKSMRHVKPNFLGFRKQMVVKIL